MCVDETLVCENSNESYWAVLSCGTIYYAKQGASNFTSVDEALECDHSNESYWAVLDVLLFIILYNLVPTFAVDQWNPFRVWPI